MLIDMGPFQLEYSPQVVGTLEALKRSDAIKLKRVRKALKLLKQDPSYPSLRTHPYEQKIARDGSPVNQSYVENNTPSAWRIWWHYGPQGTIYIDEVGPHPD